MVVGLGIDIASIARMEKALKRYGERFWERVLTPEERALLGPRLDRATALAGRFAAKEAATKALGAPRDVWWHDIEVLLGPHGGPVLSWRRAALEHLRGLGVTRSWVSISHDAGVAAAVVVLEG